MTVASVKPEAYRHLHEALDATAQHVPDLQHVLADQEAAGELILCWDGMLIHTDAFADGKSQSTTTQTTATMVLRIKRLAGSPLSTGVSATNLQVLSNRGGRPLYIARTNLGQHTISSPRKSIFLILYRLPRYGSSPTQGYQGVGVRVKTPPRGNRLNPDDETIRDIIADIRTPAEGGNATLKHYKALKHVILCPTAIKKIAQSVVVLISLHYDTDWRS